MSSAVFRVSLISILSILSILSLPGSSRFSSSRPQRSYFISHLSSFFNGFYGFAGMEDRGQPDRFPPDRVRIVHELQQQPDAFLPGVAEPQLAAGEPGPASVVRILVQG